MTQLAGTLVAASAAAFSRVSSSQSVALSSSQQAERTKLPPGRAATATRRGGLRAAKTLDGARCSGRRASSSSASPSLLLRNFFLAGVASVSSLKAQLHRLTKRSSQQDTKCLQSGVKARPRVGVEWPAKRLTLAPVVRLQSLMPDPAVARNEPSGLTHRRLAPCLPTLNLRTTEPSLRSNSKTYLAPSKQAKRVRQLTEKQTSATASAPAAAPGAVSAACSRAFLARSQTTTRPRASPTATSDLDLDLERLTPTARQVYWAVRWPCSWQA
mmetsp:Transcript_11679/g.37451  ORF Transcript_11679/g.37451 Transcript_11679/m.37451 type:complete len:271 (-) Transcript_11679:157-969(-)